MVLSSSGVKWRLFGCAVITTFRITLNLAVFSLVQYTPTLYKAALSEVAIKAREWVAKLHITSLAHAMPEHCPSKKQNTIRIR